ncbi:hypothetical protein SAMN05216203_3349 [Marinobacter daqiaonensis]|uniref:Fibronectin type-III domain-containing protein n=1 Tax=Marinobacter daqiaonensis TaxID=650891 RepID=A0A1I6JV90_9GAMM|nr:fibronectin type III domain-containing protein [Marinobacter daqiaonensis]SFR82902.1 hypothetical protein SAMN05216203_3349 [Marinobacter daqiaonensis]
MTFSHFFTFLLCLLLAGCGGDSNLSGMKPPAPAADQTNPANRTQNSDPEPTPNGSEPEEPVASDDSSDNDDVLAGGDAVKNQDPVIDFERPALQWESPLTREDGSKLFPGEISGYRVYFRLRHQEEFRSLELDGPDANSLELDDFDPGAYEFSVSTLDTNGLESRRSAPVPVDLI